jgi:tetratricopeptide (TPR) repeat protein
MSNPDKIKELFAEAAVLDQKVKEYFKAGKQEESKKAINDGIKLYNEILALSPDNAEAHYWLGNKNYELNEFPTSLSHYDKALELLNAATIDPGDLIIDVSINRTGVLCELQRFEEAIEICDQIMADYQEHQYYKDIEMSCKWIQSNCRKRMGDT